MNRAQALDVARAIVGEELRTNAGTRRLAEALAPALMRADTGAERRQGRRLAAAAEALTTPDPSPLLSRPERLP